MEVSCQCEKIRKYRNVKTVFSSVKTHLNYASADALILDGYYESIMEKCGETFDIAEAPGLYTAMTELDSEGKELIDGYIGAVDATISAIDYEIVDLMAIDKQFHDNEAFEEYEEKMLGKKPSDDSDSDG